MILTVVKNRRNMVLRILVQFCKMRFQNLNNLRFYSKYNVNKIFNKSDAIRRTFIEYFKEKNHKFIRSSPVIPFYDPTVAFVNAGMNQFKSIFLGKTTTKDTRVVNSQKCIRVGGKHNDLQVVGKDGYHHTFFEMLGNWSFGDYFKKEAQSMALNLLRNVYGLNMSRLYFTYFSGDKDLNIPPDLECYEIWKELGVPEDRIIGFGMSDNFWEMGVTGPCGPCTEIHIDHLPNTGNRSNFVNTGRADLTELWNIVFIQYNRELDGKVSNLPKKHIDTGMGFERLCAILQNKHSNYNTDLFIPIFDIISQETGAPEYKDSFTNVNSKDDLDTAYRILADHSRMITACLSDGMLPDQNQKLRRAIRTAFQISDQIFKKPNLLTKTIPSVVEILGDTYPEMQNKLNDTLELILHEQEIYKTLRSNVIRESADILPLEMLNDLDIIDNPGFIPAFKELKTLQSSFPNGIIPGSLSYKLYDTYGLQEYAIRKLVDLLNLQFDLNEFKNELEQAKQKTKSQLYLKSDVDGMQTKIDLAILKLTQDCPRTDDSFKYNYKFNKVIEEYETEPVNAKILGIIKNGEIINRNCAASNDDILCVVTDKSNFYYESGGQQSDKGIIRITTNGSCMTNNCIDFVVEDVQYVNENTVHIGRLNSANTVLTIGDMAELMVDRTHRSRNIMHHTATHLLNAAVRNLFKKVTYQVSSSVDSECLKLELCVIGKKICTNEVREIENLIRNVILNEIPVRTIHTVASEVINHPEIILVPGEIYPEDGLRLLEIQDNKIGFVSKELCCGTHILNTKDLKNFCITNLKQTNRARYAFNAVAGNRADEVINLSKAYENRVRSLEEELKSEQDKHILVEIELQKLKNKLLHASVVLPYVCRIDLLNKVNSILKKIKDSAKVTLKEFVDFEMQQVLQQKSNEPFIVHFLDSSTLLESIPLQKATRLCTDRPIMIISLNNNMVKARCCVPKDKVSDNFNAQLWLNEFASVFEAQTSPPKGQNPSQVCNMKEKRVISPVFEDQLEFAIEKANKFAKSKL